MKSLLGMGNALVDILATPKNSDEMLLKYALPKGSMQHVNELTANSIYNELAKIGCSKVAGGSASNTASGAAHLGMKAGFIGKIGADELGHFFENDQKINKVTPKLLTGNSGTGRAMVIISSDSERTFAVYLGAAVELTADELIPSMYEGYDYFHIEGYLIQSHSLLEKAVGTAKNLNMLVSLDLASYNVVDENRDFLKYVIENYVDIVFANEDEAKSFTGKAPEEAILDISKLCDIAVVKLGKHGSIVKQGEQYHAISAGDAQPVDCTGAGDLYASGFLYGLAAGRDIETCAKIGTICADKVIEVIGTKPDEARWKAAVKEIADL
ncbi:MAG: adenosine kinase [Prevotellaceae bacterium]|jgi:sugar/nucleoside kinase (ribokinase family)|nr:adenosine kinase [Prevotellaceae bacterium]